MNNYIILENRAELTTAQVLGGLNFGLIKAKAVLEAQSTIGGFTINNSFIAKGLMVATIAGLGAIVYKSYFGSDSGPETNLSLYADTSSNSRRWKAEEYHVEVSDTNIVLSTSIAAVKSPVVPIIQEEACSPGPSPQVKLEQMFLDTMKKYQGPPEMAIVAPPEKSVCQPNKPFVGSPNATCSLWQPASFNSSVDVVPSSIKLDCIPCDFYYVSGSGLDLKNYKGVWLHVTRDKKVKFKLESYLKNISLIRTEGNKSASMHPVAVGIGGPTLSGQEWLYISDKFKTGGATYHFGDHIDFYLIFEDARAGDRIVIEDFVEAMIVK